MIENNTYLIIYQSAKNYQTSLLRNSFKSIPKLLKYGMTIKYENN